MIRLLCIVIIFAITSCVADVNENKEELVSYNEKLLDNGLELILEDSLSFVISRPEGWDFKVGYKEADIVIFDTICDTCSFTSSITVLSYPIPIDRTLDDVAKENISSLSEVYLKFQIIKYSELKLNNIHSHRISYVAKLKENQFIGGITFLLKSNERFYVLSCLWDNNDDNFVKKVDFFNDISATFNLKN